MQLYSIMNLDTEHVEEICQNVKEQYEAGVSNCALFLFKLVPEGDPVIDKAGIDAPKYEIFRDRLEEMGLSCGVLVQCTLGHGYVLNKMFPYTQYINLIDGKPQYIACPSDDDMCEYLKQQMATIAALRPKAIMIDDDFRLIFRAGKGCACANHMNEFRKRTGTDIDRPTLFSILSNKDHPKRKEYTDIYVDTQRESILKAARAVREGIDSVDPTIPGIFCCVSSAAEFGAEVAKILAGEGNPPTVRIGNGNYTAAGARWLSHNASMRCAIQRSHLYKGGVKTILAETDTCPQNRYSTSAQSLHAHFTASILEGAQGAKHWITRLAAFEPASGVAYRKKLSAYSGFYAALSDLFTDVAWKGARVPLPGLPDYGFTKKPWYVYENGWASCVLERFGIPIYFDSATGGAACLEGETESFTDEELFEMCKGTLFLASDAAKELSERGFGEYLGVKVEEWDGLLANFERLPDDSKRCQPQMQLKRLLPCSAETRVDADLYHVRDGVEEIKLTPSVTVYQNTLGGTVVCFAGTPKTEYVYGQAFSFLNETRKAQLVRLMRETGNLPVYYVGDEEVFLKAGDLPDGTLFTAIFNIGLDPVDRILLNTEKRYTEAKMLTKTGERKQIPMRYENGNLVLDIPLYTLEPVILFLK